MTVAPLPLPESPSATRTLDALIADWPQLFVGRYTWPRSVWLRAYEDVLREHYPHASSDQLTLTARLAAPFPLALPGVP